jgi:hypothetical protein
VVRSVDSIVLRRDNLDLGAIVPKRPHRPRQFDPLESVSRQNRDFPSRKFPPCALLARSVSEAGTRGAEQGPRREREREGLTKLTTIVFPLLA